MKNFTTLSLDNSGKTPRKPKNNATQKTKQKQTVDISSIPDEKKWALIHNLLLDLLMHEVAENTQHLIQNDEIKNIDINSVLITAWLDYLAGYYCCMSEDTEGAKTKKDKKEHTKYDDYASRAIDTYLTAKSALLFYPFENPELLKK